MELFETNEMMPSGLRVGSANLVMLHRVDCFLDTFRAEVVCVTVFLLGGTNQNYWGQQNWSWQN